MQYSIIVPRGEERWYYTLLSNGKFQRIDIDGVVILNIVKWHDHRYDLEAFFYRRKYIFSNRSFCTKKELHGAIQKLLQELL